VSAVRLISATEVAGYEKRLRAAGALVVAAQVVSLNTTLHHHGISTNLVAAGKKKPSGAAKGAIVVAALWSAAEWNRHVNQYLAAVARDVATEAAASAAAALDTAATWGTTSAVEAQTVSIINRAQAAGAALGARVDAAALADDDIAAGVQAVMTSGSDIIGNLLGHMGQAVANMSSQSLAQQVVAYGAPTYLSATKTWNNQGDDRVRDSHQDVPDVAVNELFPVGGGMTGPGDEAGGEDETINCRCWLTYDGLVPEGSGITDEEQPDPEMNTVTAEGA
jgi:hypothetical protein